MPREYNSVAVSWYVMAAEDEAPLLYLLAAWLATPRGVTSLTVLAAHSLLQKGPIFLLPIVRGLANHAVKFAGYLSAANPLLNSAS